MQAELEADLGYTKNDSKNKTTEQSQWHLVQNTAFGSGKIEIDVLRNHDGEFEPKIVPISSATLFTRVATP